MYTLAGSVTRAPSPKAPRKSASAIGVTYSCEKRTSARTKSASPGARAGTPTRSFFRSTTACAARIFSVSVIGRGAVVMAGGVRSPAMRSLEYPKSPPPRTMSAEMGSSPRVNSSRGMASPRAMRSTSPKSVLVSSPMFCAFCE